MILVFGGSFNPPTLAHLEIIQKLCQEYKPKKFVVVPVGDDYKKPALAPFFHRMEMLKLLKDELPDCVELLDYEGKTTFKGTYETLSYIKKMYPSDQIYFVLGTDHLATLKTWIRFEDLLKEFGFIVVRRKNYTPDYTLLKSYDSRYEVFAYDNDIAATKFRMNHAKHATDLPDRVLAYIKENDLY